MFDTAAIADLDADAACAEIESTQTALREHEWRELVLAAHWAVLNDGETVASRSSASAGRPGAEPDPGRGAERAKRVGGAGTPEVAEFACAELGLMMGTGFVSASTLMRDAANLQHRHPLMWQALADGRGRVWKARAVARMADAADLSLEEAWFVDAATTPYVDTLTWSAFTRLVEARIIEADPQAAEARRLAAAMQRFVVTGQCNEHGLKTLIARAGAGEVIYFVAMCDRIAQVLRLEGDPDPVDVRRSKALAILANPARALAMLERYASDEPHPADPDPAPDPGPGPAPVRQPDTSHVRAADEQTRLDPERLRPRAVLYVRISEEALRSGAGVAHCESGVGPVTVPAIADLLGHHHVTVRPVLDLRGQVPVDAYEVPNAMREALRLARPSSVFPWSRSGSSTPDLDHTRPYTPVEAGSSLRQTRVGNIGPMVRFGHRVKTHGRGWRHRQPSAGVYLWRTPHGYWFRVDQDGTHALGRDPDLTEASPTVPQTVGERAFADLIAAS